MWLRRTGTRVVQLSKMVDELEGWDPRVQDYHDHHSSTMANSGPLSNFSRVPVPLTNLARKQDSVREPRGLYIKNVPRAMTSENLKRMFSEHGSVLSVFVGQPNPEFLAANITWAIVKVTSMKDSLAMITGLNNKPPLNLRVELSMTEEEKRRRKGEKEREQQFHKEIEEQAKPVMSGHNPASLSPSTTGVGRGRRMFSSPEDSSMRQPQMAEGQKFGNPPVVDKSVEVERSTTPTTPDPQPPPPASVVEVGRGTVVVRYRKPLPCVHCLFPGKLRCSVCKAWYCGKLCQVDDWYYHKKTCSSPPNLEDPDVDIVSEVDVPKSGVVVSSVDNLADVAYGGGRSDNLELRKPKQKVRGLKESKQTVQKLNEAKNVERIMSPAQSVTGPQKMIRESPSTHHSGQLRRPFPTEEKNVMQTSHTSGADTTRDVTITHNTEVKQPTASEQDLPAKEDVTDSNINVKSSDSRSKYYTPERSPDSGSQNTASSDMRLTLENLPHMSNTLKLESEYTGGITLVKSFKKFTAAMFVEGSGDILTGAHDFLASIPIDPSFRPEVGSLVAAFSTNDETWYRGFLCSVDNGDCRVFYIDFGNMEAVSLIKPLPVGKYTDIPGLAMVAELHGDVKPDVQKLLEEVVQENSQIAFKVIGKKSKSVKVSLIFDEVSKFAVEYILKPWYASLSISGDKILGLLPTSEFSRVQSKTVHPVPSPSQKTVPDTESFEKPPISTTHNSSEDVSASSNLTPSSIVYDRNEQMSSSSFHPGPVAADPCKLQSPSLKHESTTLQKDKDSELPLQNGVQKASLEEPKQPSVITTKCSVDPLSTDTLKGTEKINETQTYKKYWARNLAIAELKVGKEYSIYPVWVDQDNNLFIHVIGDQFITRHQDLVSKVALHCEKGTRVSELEVGELACGYISSDDLWYRVEVLQTQPHRATLHFIDYGDQLDLEMTDIKEFSAGLMEYPQTCVKVRVSGVRKDDAVAHKKLFALVDAQTNLTLVSRGGDVGVELFDKNMVSLNSQLVSSAEKSMPCQSNPKQDAVSNDAPCSPADLTHSNTAQWSVSSEIQLEKEKSETEEDDVIKCSSSVLPTPAFTSSPISPYATQGAMPKGTKPPASSPHPEVCKTMVATKIKDNLEVGIHAPMYQDCKIIPLTVGQGVQVLVLEAIKPHVIFVVPADTLYLFEKLEDMGDKINAYCNDRPGHLYRPIQGELCLGQFSADKKWYRAVCICPEIESSLLLFVDYGNSEDIPSTNIRQVPTAFLKQPCMAVHCLLNGVSLDDVKEGASERLAELLPSSTLKTVDVLQNNNDGTYTIDIPDVKEVLVTEGLIKSE